uniref:Adenylate kinase n=1 Tax=Romanomermis culicivorax TaxID=13658 RepID=A0A915KHL0_ROMCU
MVKSKDAKGFLIDGYPRDVVQGQKFEAEIWECSLVVYFDVSDATMTKRLLGRAITSGRIDDNEETIKKRLVTFHSQTKPVVDYYDQKKKLVT